MSKILSISCIIICLISLCHGAPYPRETICRHIYPIPCHIVNIEIKDYNSISEGMCSKLFNFSLDFHSNLTDQNEAKSPEKGPEVYLVKTITESGSTGNSEKSSSFLNRPMKWIKKVLFLTVIPNSVSMSMQNNTNGFLIGTFLKLLHWKVHIFFCERIGLNRPYSTAKIRTHECDWNWPSRKRPTMSSHAWPPE